ncbi:hypothetical protein EDF33_102243 [Curtobacterium sp. PhB146]|nr:hypothetical protein EDF33_102243 [Curtobacterium sp. PhB146]
MSKHAATDTADARQRSLRTLAQGLAVDVAIAGAAAGYAVVQHWSGDDVLSTAAWIAAGTAVVKSVLTAGLSYVARLRMPPTSPTE